jgi:hypothetical protein
MKNRLDINVVLLLVLLTLASCMMLDFKYRFSDMARAYKNLTAEKHLHKDGVKTRINLFFSNFDRSNKVGVKRSKNK